VRHEIRREDRLALALRFWCGDVAMKVVDRGSLIGLADAVGKDVMVFVPFRNLVNPGPEDYAERNDLYRKRRVVFVLDLQLEACLPQTGVEA
jgi:hypothetical protein